jgi:SAM-dependent methyltransferase
MGTIIHVPDVRGWEAAYSYCRMTCNPRLPFIRQSDYSNRQKEFNWRLAYVIKDKRLGGQNFLSGRQALVVGPGPTPEEARLILTAFPELAGVRLVEWYKPNVEAIERNLGPDLTGRTEVYCADAANMDKIEKGSVHLVYMHSVIEDIEGYGTPVYPNKDKAIPQKVQDIFREIKRVLALGGFIFTLGTKHTPELEGFLKGLGFAIIPVIVKVEGKDVEIRDIWIKIRE